MIKLEQIKLPLNYTNTTLIGVVASALGVEKSAVHEVKILKRSIDARHKPTLSYVASLSVSVDGEDLIKKQGKAVEFTALPTRIQELNMPRSNRTVVIIGAGPAGLFASSVLATFGAHPILIERGSAVERRSAVVEKCRVTGEFNPHTNIQFGEGGAGTFSDGKLNTGTVSPYTGVVLGEFIHHGAPEEIGYFAKPHIGTDYLVSVVRSMREEVIAMGGAVYFDTKMTDLVIRNGQIVGVKVEGAKSGTIATDAVILALGHSARDTYEMLAGQGVSMEQKPFSVGVRIEHLQADINKSLYGRADAPFAADYKIATHFPSGRGVYTFCMCPGGSVVMAASEEGGIVTNGMSEYARSGVNANAAVLVGVDGRDFGTELFDGMNFQRRLERSAYAVSNSYSAPVQRLGDFQEGRITSVFGRVSPTVLPTPTCADLNKILPPFVATALKDGIREFGRKVRGFDQLDAILTGVETRSSSPIRILRDGAFQSNISGLYPVGEGAGYAGGIVSSAVDAIRCVAALLGEKQE